MRAVGKSLAWRHNQGMRHPLWIGAILVLAACENPAPPTSNAREQVAATTSGSSSEGNTTATTPPTNPAYDFYGAGTELAGTVPVSDVLKSPDSHLAGTVRLRGPIVGTCAKKGCWMRLGAEDHNVFVKFKDYGFFVPTEGVEGREAVIEGTLAVETQTVEEVKHYLEDAGKLEEAAKVTEPRQVLSFLATGVAIKKP